jgi:CubicO group peptidase (beta-lactamase class C family)
MDAIRCLKMMRICFVFLVACAGAGPEARPHHPPPPPVEPAKPAPPPALAQLFADGDPSYTFADPQRKAKLLAAMTKVDTAIEAEMASQNVPGLALGVVIDGELAYAKGYGVADVDTKSAPDADTVYRIGSISKSIAALGLLALRDDGVLQLDDPLVRWVPEASALIYPTHDARPITLRQLLTHTSGLARDVDFKKTSSEKEFLAQLQGVALDHSPGEQFVYSNLGFALVGIVVARASHSATIAEAITKRVFGPLGMTASGYDVSPKLVPAYDEDNKTHKKDLERLAVAGGAGGVVSSVRDMARYVAFELSAYPPRSGDDTGVLHRATIREAHSTGFFAGAAIQPQPDAKHGEPAFELEAATYGFGWQHHKTCEFDDLVEHGGSIDSYRSSVQLLTQHGVGVVVLTNFGNANTYAIGKRVFDEMRATGALLPYALHPKLAPVFDVTATKFLAIYNDWNEDALKALLNRPMDPLEPAEIAGYKKLHGSCSAFVVREIRSATSATLALTCERGQLELSIDIGPDGRMQGFLGTSRNVAVPGDITKLANAWLALVARWDEGAYTRTFVDRKLHDQMKTVGKTVTANFGTCKIAEMVHEATGWGFDATCERGKLHFFMDLETGKIKTMDIQKLEGGGCPVK